MNKCVSRRLLLLAGVLRGAWCPSAAPNIEHPSVRPHRFCGLNSLNRPSGLSTGNHSSNRLLLIGKVENNLKRGGRDSTFPPNLKRSILVKQHEDNHDYTTDLINTAIIHQPKPAAPMSKRSPFVWNRGDHFLPWEKVPHPG